MAKTKRLIVCMGVCGCGKTTLAKALSKATNSPMLEGDEFHPRSNIEKMRDGVALQDEDREAWIQAIRTETDHRPDETLILSCSALSANVQNWLTKDNPRKVSWAWLKLSEAEARRRVSTRTDHFMPSSLVQSQFEALDPPKDCIGLDAMQDVDQIVEELLCALKHC